MQGIGFQTEFTTHLLSAVMFSGRAYFIINLQMFFLPHTLTHVHVRRRTKEKGSNKVPKWQRDNKG